MSVLCSNLINLNEEKTVYIDGDSSAKLTGYVYLLSSDLTLKDYKALSFKYKGNYLWETTIPSLSYSGVILGIIFIEEGRYKTYGNFFLKTKDLNDTIVYFDNVFDSVEVKALQIDQNGNVIDDTTLKKVKYNMFVGKIPKNIPSIICTDKTCSIYTPAATIETTKSDEAVQNNSQEISSLLLELEELKKQLEQCKNLTTIVIDHSKIKDSTHLTKTKLNSDITESSLNPTTPTVKTNINKTQTIKINQSPIKAKLK